MVEAKATIKLLVSASKTRRFLNKDKYQSKVKPLQTALMRDSLKEYNAKINKGKYKKAKMAIAYAHNT